MVLIDPSNTDSFSFSNGYYIHQYTVTGTRSITVLDGGIVEVLVVAGGGGGGTSTDRFAPSGGGGGGEVVHRTSHTIRSGTLTVTIGAGGATSSNGGNSVFGTIETNGGGAGGVNYGAGSTGGSGGGAGRQNTTRAASVKLSADGKGFAGGITSTGGAGGGGGATAQGQDRSGTNTGGAGGQGYSTTITGTSQVFGSGGAGGSRAGSTIPQGGTNAGNGGGGEFSSLSATTAIVNATSAINGFGGGGGGSGVGGNYPVIGTGGTGGSGRVIVKYYIGTSTIYKPVNFTGIKSALGTTTNNLGSYRNTKVSYKGLYSSLPSSSSAISHSNFVDTSKSIVTTGLSLFYDPANTSSYSGSGTTLTDLSGNNRNGTLENGSTVNADKQIVLNGASNYVSTTYQPNLDNLRPYTYELWFWDNAAGGFFDNTALISNYGATNTTPNSQLHITDTGIVRFFERNSSSVSAAASNTSSVCNSLWNHIAAVATSTDLVLYINGVNVATATRPGGAITSSMSIVIGGQHFDRYQTCRLGPVRIYYDKALSATEVIQNYETERYRESLNVS